MSSRITPIIRKEFIHIRRDFRTLIIIFIMPVAQLLMFGYAINVEIQNIALAVIDHSKSPASRELVRAFQGSKFFTVRYFDESENLVGDLFQSRTARVALIIPQDFAQTIERPIATKVQVLIDASDSNAAQAILNYSDAILQTYNAGRGVAAPFGVQTTIQYNPTLKSAYFFVPGLVALILIMISALLTSVAIAREKETGTMEQILVSPVRPREIIIGKVVPYIVLAFMDGVIILLVAYFWFNVPMMGSVALLLGAALVYVFVALAIGLFISTIAHTQQVAMVAALVTSMLPSIMLSGFLFPIASMPKALQLITNVVPAKYFLVIVRGIMLKGNTVMQIGWPLLVLVGMGIFFTAVSTKKFKTTLET
jgi:ABC-2 type transport system permease protein